MSIAFTSFLVLPLPSHFAYIPIQFPDLLKLLSLRMYECVCVCMHVCMCAVYSVHLVVLICAYI